MSTRFYTNGMRMRFVYKNKDVFTAPKKELFMYNLL